MIEIKVKNGNVELALKTLSRKMGRFGVFREMREREYFVKPSAKRNIRKKALKRVRKYDKR